MKYQRSPGWCGPAALQNCLRFLGLRVGQQSIARVAGTTADKGTSEEGLIRACLALRLEVDEFSKDDRRSAGLWLLSNVRSGYGSILCVDDYEHYVAVAGEFRDRLCLVDSTNEWWNQQENGIHWWRIRDILNRWEASKASREKGAAFWGIAVSDGKAVSAPRHRWA